MIPEGDEPLPRRMVALKSNVPGWVRWIGPPIAMPAPFGSRHMVPALHRDAEGRWRATLIEPYDTPRNPRPHFRPWNKEKR